VQRHLVRGPARGQVRLREEAQRHAPRVGGEQREVGHALRGVFAVTAGSAGAAGVVLAGAAAHLRRRTVRRGARTAAGSSVAPIGSGAPAAGAICSGWHAGCPDGCAWRAVKPVACSSGGLVAAGSGAATNAASARGLRCARACTPARLHQHRPLMSVHDNSRC